MISMIKDFLHADNEGVRASAIWALGELMPAKDFAALRDEYLPDEDNPALRAEWRDEWRDK
jgi:HEAT repeat protein